MLSRSQWPPRLVCGLGKGQGWTCPSSLPRHLLGQVTGSLPHHTSKLYELDTLVLACSLSYILRASLQNMSVLPFP